VTYCLLFPSTVSSVSFPELQKIKQPVNYGDTKGSAIFNFRLTERNCTIG